MITKTFFIGDSFYTLDEMLQENADAADVCEWLRNAAIGDKLDLGMGETVECVNGSLLSYMNDEMTPEQENEFEVWLLESGSVDEWAMIEADVALRLMIGEALGATV